MENLPIKIDGKVIEDFLFTTETKLTEQHKKLFLNLAVRNQLDPFKREIYAIPYEVGGKIQLSIVTGYEVYLKRAERSGKLDGWKCWTEGESDKLKAIIEIKRKDWSQPFRHEVLLKEYDLGYKIWKSKPQTMIKKVAMAQAFRLCFPDELGGMPYTADEIDTHIEIDTTPIEPPKIDMKEAIKNIKETFPESIDMELFKKESEKKFTEYHDRMMGIKNGFELKAYYKKHFHEMEKVLLPEHLELIKQLKDKLKEKFSNEATQN